MTRVLTEFCLPSTLIVDKLPDDLLQDNRRLGDHDGAAVSQRRLSAPGAGPRTARRRSQWLDARRRVRR